jgi:hypothetical protein
MKTVTIEHIPGYSRVDHVGEELAGMARDEFEGRPQTLRSAWAAITRAEQKARALAKCDPAGHGVFRFSLPRIIARHEAPHVPR